MDELSSHRGLPSLVSLTLSDSSQASDELATGTTHVSRSRLSCQKAAKMSGAGQRRTVRTAGLGRGLIHARDVFESRMTLLCPAAAEWGRHG